MSSSSIFLLPVIAALALTLSLCLVLVPVIVNAAAPASGSAVPAVYPSAFLYGWYPSLVTADPTRPVYYVLDDRPMWLSQISAIDGSTMATIKGINSTDGYTIDALSVSPTDSSLYVLIHQYTNADYIALYHYDAALSLIRIITDFSPMIPPYPVYPAEQGITTLGITTDGKLILQRSLQVWIIDTATDTQSDYWPITGLPQGANRYTVAADQYGVLYVQPLSVRATDAGVCYEYDLHGNALGTLTVNRSMITMISSMAVANDGTLIIVDAIRVYIITRTGMFWRSFAHQLTVGSYAVSPQVSYDALQSRLIVTNGWDGRNPTTVDPRILFYDLQGHYISSYSSQVKSLWGAAFTYDRQHPSSLYAALNNEMTDRLISLDTQTGTVLHRYALPAPYDSYAQYTILALSVHPADTDTIAMLLTQRGNTLPTCLLYSISTAQITQSFTFAANLYPGLPFLYDASLQTVFIARSFVNPIISVLNATSGAVIRNLTFSGSYPIALAQSAATGSDLYVVSGAVSIIRMTADGIPVGQPYDFSANANVYALTLDDAGQLYVTMARRDYSDLCIVQLSNAGTVIAEYRIEHVTGPWFVMVAVSPDGSALLALDSVSGALIEWNSNSTAVKAVDRVSSD